MKALIHTAALAPVMCVLLSAQSTKTDPIWVRCVLPKSTICLGAKETDIEAEIRNTSGKPVRLSVAGLGYATRFLFHGCSIEDGFKATETRGDPFPGSKPRQLITLKPGTSYRTAWKLSLDPEFFSNAGIYSVIIEYSGLFGGSGVKGVFQGFVSSNRVYFEIENCTASGLESR